MCVPFLFHREMRSLCCYGANRELTWGSRGRGMWHLNISPQSKMRKDERGGEVGGGGVTTRDGREEGGWGEGGLGRLQWTVQDLGNSYFLSPSLILSFFSFSCSPSLTVKAQYPRHCNYWHGKDERSQLLAEEREVTEWGGRIFQLSKASNGQALRRKII